MKKNRTLSFSSLLLFLLVSILSLTSKASESQMLHTSGRGLSDSVSLASSADELAANKFIAIDMAKGQCLGLANEICENQKHGHVLLTSLTYTEPQCAFENQSLLSGRFICTIQAAVECD